jgi:hypothetical protein
LRDIVILKPSTRKIIRRLETPFDVEFFITEPENGRLLLIHKEIFAFTIDTVNCSRLNENQIDKLNSVIRLYYPNAFIILTKFKRLLWLSRLNTPILNLGEYGPTITLQGRSWDDHCLQIIDLEQNYRWELNQDYNYHLYV